MRPGRVAQVRVSPADCMSICDVMNKLGINTPGLSFPQALSLTLSSALEAFRQNNVIPTRDGFEYTELMARFPQDRLSDRARKLEVTKAIGLRPAPALVPESIDAKRRRTRYEELKFKFQQDPGNVSEEERNELRGLTEEFFT